MTARGWSLLVVGYAVALWALIWAVGSVLDGVAYWLIGGVISAVGLAAGVWLIRQALKASQRSRSDAEARRRRSG